MNHTLNSFFIFCVRNCWPHLLNRLLCDALAVQLAIFVHEWDIKASADDSTQGNPGTSAKSYSMTFSHMTMHFTLLISTFRSGEKSTHGIIYRDLVDVDKENASRKSKYWPAVIKAPWEVENPSEMNLSAARKTKHQIVLWLKMMLAAEPPRDRFISFSNVYGGKKVPGAVVLVREYRAFFFSPFRVTYPHTYDRIRSFHKPIPQFSGHFWFYIFFSSAWMKHKSRKKASYSDLKSTWTDVFREAQNLCVWSFQIVLSKYRRCLDICKWRK